MLRAASDKNRSAPALRAAARSRRRRWAPLHHGSRDHPPTPTPSWRGLPPLCRGSRCARNPDESLFFRRTAAVPDNVCGNGVVALRDAQRRGGCSDNALRHGATTPDGTVARSRPRNTPGRGRTCRTGARGSRSADTGTTATLRAPIPPRAALDSAGGGRHKGPAESPHRRTALPRARGLSGIVPRAFACLVPDKQHIESARANGAVPRQLARQQRAARKPTLRENRRGALDSLGGSEAAGSGRLRPAQPASRKDPHDLIEAAATRRHGLNDASTVRTPPLAKLLRLRI